MSPAAAWRSGAAARSPRSRKARPPPTSRPRLPSRRQIVRHLAARPESCNCRAQRGFTVKAGGKKGGHFSLIGSLSGEGEWFLLRQCGHRGCDGGVLRAVFVHLRAVFTPQSYPTLTGEWLPAEEPLSNTPGPPLTPPEPTRAPEGRPMSEQSAHGPRRFMAGSACTVYSTLYITS